MYRTIACAGSFPAANAVDALRASIAAFLALEAFLGFWIEKPILFSLFTFVQCCYTNSCNNKK
jgi:hypothetical protein